MIDHQNKLRFIQIPKTASGTIVEFMKRHSNNYEEEDHPVLFRDSKSFPYTTFTVVRNPYDLIYSYTFWNHGSKIVDQKSFDKYSVHTVKKFVVRYGCQMDMIRNTDPVIFYFENAFKQGSVSTDDFSVFGYLKKFYKTDKEFLHLHEKKKQIFKFCKKAMDLINIYFAKDFENLGYKQIL